MKPRVRAAFLALATATAGCSGEQPPASPSVSASENSTSTAEASIDQSADPAALSPPPILAEDEVPLTCGSPLTFSAQALLAVPGAETADHPAAEALRMYLQESPLPRRAGWRLVVFSDEHALFLLPATPAEGSAFWSAEFERSESSWTYVRSGQCDIKPGFEGLEPARWELAPGEQPRPESRTLHVLVTEQGCASGTSPEGRIVPAAVIYLEDSVIVIFGTRPLPGPQTCLPGPPVEVTVDLHEQIGDRQLLDGSILPPEPRG